MLFCFLVFWYRQKHFKINNNHNMSSASKVYFVLGGSGPICSGCVIMTVYCVFKTLHYVNSLINVLCIKCELCVFIITVNFIRNIVHIFNVDFSLSYTINHL